MNKNCMMLTAYLLAFNCNVLAQALDNEVSPPYRLAQAPAMQAPGNAPKSDAPPMREFEPPPVPEFMLRKSTQPLTIEEMRRQADEASERARRARSPTSKPSPMETEQAPLAPNQR